MYGVASLDVDVMASGGQRSLINRPLRATMRPMDADVVVVGAGLAGLVATAELVDAGRRVVLVDQEPEASLGGQAFWSFGGLFGVDTPQQRRMGVRDSLDLAWQDWLGTAGFAHHDCDRWGRRWARDYVEWVAGEQQGWLRELGIRFFPVVGWAERGGQLADGPGNSVPRFHIVWGTGPALLQPFERRVRDGARRGLVRLAFRHQVDRLTSTNGVVDGVHGTVLEPSLAERGAPSSRVAAGQFSLSAQAVLVTSGGIGGNQALVREAWPARLGSVPQDLLTGVPASTDGRMLAISEGVGARVTNRDRMWHYTEGIANHSPVWSGHGIRILPGPSSLWFDATGRRMPAQHLPGFDTLGALEHLRRTGYDYSWFVLTERILEKEFALSGSEQNPDLTGKDLRGVLGRIRGGAPMPVAAFAKRGVDFVVRSTLRELVAGMNALAGNELLDHDVVHRQILARDRELDNDFGKDAQIAAIRAARRYRGDRLIRTVRPHRILDPSAGPLVAVRLRVLTRKTLGGLQSDLSGRVLDAHGKPVPGLYAAGEVAGFGGGGMHGYRSLEGTFLGGCLFGGRMAGRALAVGTA